MKPSAVDAQRPPRFFALLLVSFAVLGCAGCAGLAALARADAEHNAPCVRLCESVLHRSSLGLSDGHGTCACFAPAQTWETTPGSAPGALTARIHTAAPVSPALTVATAVASTR